MQDVTLPLWLVFAYPLFALIAYIILVKLIRSSGPNYFFKMVESGQGDQAFDALVKRYGPKIMKVFGGAILNDLVSIIDGRARGKLGAINKKVLKSEKDAEEYMISEFAQRYPVLGYMADTVGIEVPNHPLFQIIADPIITKAEIKAQEMIKQQAGKTEQFLNIPQTHIPPNGTQMPQMQVPNPELHGNAKALLQQTPQKQSQETQEQGQG